MTRRAPEGRRSHRPLFLSAAVLLAAVVVFYLVLYVLPATLASGSGSEFASSEGEARSALLQASGGLLLAVGLYLTWATLRLNRQGQVTERFTRAIDQLGNERTDVRIGGIYALERIAFDSRGHHSAIVEVLATFVREHSHRRASTASRGDDSPSGPSSGPAVRVDVQAALTVLGRRRRVFDAPGSRIDLTGVRLQHARLEAADLESAMLRDADLSHADLRGARLGHADLTRSLLVGAVLRGADVSDAILLGTDLRGAVMGEALLNGATLVTARLDGASLKGAFADGRTSWPRGFDPDDELVVIESPRPGEG
ncbi:MAG: pentapeptide repeat-containing protein [Thermoleophilia bacterium]|nr:pentapeptide repeat-containing protein [Thermoleophilia bacterium]